MSAAELNPADVKVEILLQQLGGFAPVASSGVRLTHTPTGITVEATKGRSQHANREAAWQRLAVLVGAARQQPSPQPHQNDHHQGVIMESKQIEALLAVRRFVENNTVSADNGYAAGVDAANHNVITHIDWLLEQVRAGHEIPFKVEHNSKWPFDARVTSPPTQSAPQPLTEPELRAVLQETNDMIRNAMRGPFWPELEQACRAIERAHGIKEQP